ncbi:MAG: hypothetical protein R6V17_01015 [Halanaerobacter sp.]
MCVIIKNGNVTTQFGSYKTDIALKDERLFPVDDKFECDGAKVIDASNAIADCILSSFNRRY